MVKFLYGLLILLVVAVIIAANPKTNGKLRSWLRPGSSDVDMVQKPLATGNNDLSGTLLDASLLVEDEKTSKSDGSHEGTSEVQLREMSPQKIAEMEERIRKEREREQKIFEEDLENQPKRLLAEGHNFGPYDIDVDGLVQKIDENRIALWASRLIKRRYPNGTEVRGFWMVNESDLREVPDSKAFITIDDQGREHFISGKIMVRYDESVDIYAMKGRPNVLHIMPRIRTVIYQYKTREDIASGQLSLKKSKGVENTEFDILGSVRRAK